jgi:hypothetical protein
MGIFFVFGNLLQLDDYFSKNEIHEKLVISKDLFTIL